MKWTRELKYYKKRFAFFPITDGDGNWAWLSFYKVNRWGKKTSRFFKHESILCERFYNKKYMAKICIVESCDREKDALGMCPKHYMIEYNQRSEVKKRERAYRREYSKKERALLKKARALEKARPELFNSENFKQVL